MTGSSGSATPGTDSPTTPARKTPSAGPSTCVLTSPPPGTTWRTPSPGRSVGTRRSSRQKPPCVSREARAGGQEEDGALAPDHDVLDHDRAHEPDGHFLVGAREADPARRRPLGDDGEPGDHPEATGELG